MGKFLESEKPIQTQFKLNSGFFSKNAKDAGFYSKKYRPFCIPEVYAEENLIPEIRETVLNHFSKNKIKWHNGKNEKPSNHMCDSQVCCVNFLFPFADKPDALVSLLRPLFPQIERMLPVENGQYVSFEWIGEKNYLLEVTRNENRSRGALFTSADAIVMFERSDKKRHIVLIEWKYTESYSRTFLKYSDSGRDRTSVYRHLFGKPDCPIEKKLLPDFEDLFYEPFYQFMRQQFLAHEMEKAHEMGADIVSVLHIAPAHNNDFCKVTSQKLIGIGDSATHVWEKLVKPEGRFISISTEKLFGQISEKQFPEIKSWKDYIFARYKWLNM